MFKKSAFILIAGTAMLAGCANSILSDERIKSNTALALNQPENAITISDRRYDGMTNTYYTARTPRGTYACAINGGTLLSAGIVNPPQCSPR